MKKNRIAIIIFVVVAICAIASIIPAQQREDKIAVEAAAETTTLAVTTTTVEKTTTTTAKRSPEEITRERVAEAVKSNFAKSSDNSNSFSDGGRSVVIRAMGQDNLTDKMIRGGMWLSIYNTLDAVKDDSLIEDICFDILFPMVDKYGNESTESVMKADFPKVVRDKINWKNFFSQSIPDIAIDYWQSPALPK